MYMQFNNSKQTLLLQDKYIIETLAILKKLAKVAVHYRDRINT
jgi:hypothetical protein